MLLVLGHWLAACRALGASACGYYALRLLAPACTLTLDWAYAVFWMASDAVLATAARWLWHGGVGRRVWALVINSASAFANVLLALSLWLQGAGFNAQFFFHATAETLLWGYEALAPVFYGCWAYWLLLSLWPFALRGAAHTTRRGAAPTTRRGAAPTTYRGAAPTTCRVVAFAGVSVALNAPLLSLAWNAVSVAAEQQHVLFVPKTADAAIWPEPLPSPRNLVLVVAEGLEATYGLPEVFGEDATPRLTALSKEGVRFANMRQVSHTSWTTGAMVAAQCAFPMGPAGNFNTVVGGARLEARAAGATCLGDVLQAQGYRTVYLGGASLAFGNKGEFLAEHGWDDRYGRRRLQRKVRHASQTSSLGVRDDFLFAFALDKLAELAATPPFALALLTLDTHGPFGFPSAACGRNTGEGLLFAIRCADRMLAEFIVAVRRRHPDALVALLSDHLGNFNDLRRQEPPADARRLRFTVWGEGIGPATIHRRGTHFDVTPTLFDLLGFARWTELNLGASLLRFDSPWFAHARPERLRVVHALPAIRARPGDAVSFHAEGPVIEIDGVRMLATHRGLRLREAVFAIAFDAGGAAVRHHAFAGAGALLRQVEQWADGQVLAGVSTHPSFNRQLSCGAVGQRFFAGYIGAPDFVCGPLDEGASVSVPLRVPRLAVRAVDATKAQPQGAASAQ